MTQIDGVLAAILIGLAFVYDIRQLRIPNLLTVSFFAAGLLYQLVADGWHGAAFSLAGALAGFLPLLVLYALKGIGAGDVKLFGALGAVVGAEQTLQVLLYSILYGGVFGAALLVLNQTFARRMLLLGVSLFSQNRDLLAGGVESLKKERLRFPFMIAVLPGAVTAWFLAI
ncbi:A24 family peptidase [Paenibacillus silvisoli]|uniref:A24 family peptidase n=1 Tax=Paenibacillus silvisoli TaxID=3110539 RepID=UPI002804FD5D|nr:A24 family peptidase [Paenibacillus silvisoli]